MGLLERPGIETDKLVVFKTVGDLDWFAANFAVFDVGLPPNGQVENHRNFFTTIRATECVFHGNSMQQLVGTSLRASVLGSNPTVRREGLGQIVFPSSRQFGNH